MEYLGEITDTRQHEFQVHVVYPAGENEYNMCGQKNEMNVIISWKNSFQN